MPNANLDIVTVIKIQIRKEPVRLEIQWRNMMNRERKRKNFVGETCSTIQLC